MTCKKVTALIADYLTGELDPETTSAFERHLLECPDCVSFLKTYKKSTQAIRSLRYQDIPPEMRRRVRKFLQQKVKGIQAN